MVFVTAAEDIAGFTFNRSEIRTKTIHSSFDINNHIKF